MRTSGTVTKPRLPPLALVLLPALALAAVGVRAVTAEMRASQDAARERARSVASRLARSVDALVAEYAGALPRPGTKLTRAEAKEATAHLRPRRTLTTDGVSLALDHDLPPDPGPIPSKESELAEDALQRATRFSRDPNGSVAAAAITAATARAVEHPAARARLLIASAGHEAATDRSPSRMKEAMELGAFRRDVDGVPFDVQALRLLAGSFRPGATARDCEDVYEVYARVAEDPWGLPDDQRAMALADVQASWPRGLWPGVKEEWDEARRLARALREGEAPPAATFKPGPPGNPTLTVWSNAIVDGRPSLIGGDIPPAAFDERITKEAYVLAHEASTLRLLPREGSPLLALSGAAIRRGADAVVETVPLAEPLSSWRAEAVVATESGVPATAWMLGAALVVTTAALLAGTIALRRAAERSARLADERRTFLDHVAHELRTPAAAVQALTEELASGHVTPEREVLYRAHLLRESRRLSALVEDTLDFARLDAGRLAFTMEPADLREVVREAVEQSEGAGRVQATLPDAPVVRPIDAAALRRAVKNLVENAVRHGGGDAPVTVTLEARNGAASIVVADRGRGIAAEHLPRLFERFYRVPSATHEVKGVGLGLALCREIACGHGGDVTVTSEVGRGSTFTLRVPLGDVLHFQLPPSDAPRQGDESGEVESEERPRRSEP